MHRSNARASREEPGHAVTNDSRGDFSKLRHRLLRYAALWLEDGSELHGRSPDLTANFRGSG